MDCVTCFCFPDTQAAEVRMIVMGETWGCERPYTGMKTKGDADAMVITTVGRLE